MISLWWLKVGWTKYKTFILVIQPLSWQRSSGEMYEYFIFLDDLCVFRFNYKHQVHINDNGSWRDTFIRMWSGLTRWCWNHTFTCVFPFLHQWLKCCDYVSPINLRYFIFSLIFVMIDGVLSATHTCIHDKWRLLDVITLQK